MKTGSPDQRHGLHLGRIQAIQACFLWIFFLLSFIVIRPASFHHIDEILRFELFGARINWLLELTGIYLDALAVFRKIMAHRKGQ